MKRTPLRGVKKNLKSCAYKLWESAFGGSPYAFCIMNLRVTFGSKAKPSGGAEAKASANSAPLELPEVDPKPL